MQFFGAFHQLEANAKLAVQRFRVIAHNFKPAALGRPVRSECADNHVPASLRGAHNIANIGGALLRTSQKMKYGAVMPHIESSGRQSRFSDIGYKSMKLVCRGPKAFSRHIDDGLGDVENCDVGVPTR